MNSFSYHVAYVGRAGIIRRSRLQAFLDDYFTPIFVAVVGFLGCAVLISFMMAESAATKKSDLMKPRWPTGQLQAEYNYLQQLSTTKTPSGTEYRQNIDRFQRFSDAVRRAEADGTISRGFGPYGVPNAQAQPLNFDIVDATRLTDTYSQTNNSNIGNKNFIAEVAAYNQQHPPDPNQYHTGLDLSTTGIWFALTWIVSSLLMFFYFSRELRDNGARVMMEFATGRLPFYSVFWIRGYFKYPKNVNAAEQWQRLKRTAAFVLSSAISVAASAKKPNPEQTEQSVDQTKTWMIDISTTTFSKYLGANGAIFKDGPVQQTTATITKGRFYAGMFHSAPYIAQQHPDFGFEVDGFGGVNARLCGFRVHGEIMYIATAPLRHSRGDVLQFTGDIYRDFKIGERQTFSPGITINRATPVASPNPRAGFFFRPGFTYSWQATSRYALNSSVDITRDAQGAFGFNPATVGRASVKGSFPLNKNWSVQLPVVQFAQPLTHVSDGRKQQFILGTGLSFHY